MSENVAPRAQIAEEEEDDEDDDFLDAIENLPMEGSGGDELEVWIDQVQKSFYNYLNNNFEEAQQALEKLAEKSMYHSLGRASLSTFQAAMTFQSIDIEQGLKSLKVCSTVCEGHRKRMGFIQNLAKNKKLHYSQLNNYEVHAELCYAECLLEQAFLTFIQDENFTSFIKGALKVRTCLSTYKTAVEIMRKRDWKEGMAKVHFESGICLGVGAFNLMLSLLPPKILKVLEFVGFKASKEKGLRELEKGADMTTSLRAPVCSILLIMYHIYIDYIFGLGEGDLVMSDRLLRALLNKCPKSAIFVFLDGRLLEVSGDINKAILRFEESIASQSVWKQFHHFCYWELMWCHAYQGNWLLAMKYAEVLFEESKWSRTIAAYQAGVFMMMVMTTMTRDGYQEEKEEEDKRGKMLNHINAMFTEVPHWKQRIAGKSVPVEKWCVRKAEMFKLNQKPLVLPAYELFFIWNGFEVLRKLPGKMAEMLVLIDQELESHLQLPATTTPHYHDDLALIYLLKGVCLRHNNQTTEAITNLQLVVNFAKLIRHETHLVPSCLYELGLATMQAGDNKMAEKYLVSAKNDYTGYQLESRTCSKIQAALVKLKAANNYNNSKEIKHNKNINTSCSDDNTFNNNIDNDNNSNTSNDSSNYSISNLNIVDPNTISNTNNNILQQHPTPKAQASKTGL